MTPKEFKKYLERDFNECVHCGISDDTLVPQHRKNRGHGGSKLLNQSSNIIVLCSEFNGRIESDPNAAALARRFGWKLNSWEDPTEVPIHSRGLYWLLDDKFGRVELLGYDD